MNWIKWVIISLAVLAFMVAGGFVIYHAAYAWGDTSGYSRGYSTGQEIGYSSGEQAGYNAGYSLGKGEGYNQGYRLGRTDGYEEGYGNGVEAGLGHGYTLRDPTYKQAVDFLERDKTDRNEYDEDSYICSHFARDVGNNAEAEGLRCALVELRYSEGGHTIIAFDTIDKGLVYFEPQFDDEVEVIIERSYSHLNDYLEPSIDDTIIDILVIW
jgi:hypothetical protein